LGEYFDAVPGESNKVFGESYKVCWLRGADIVASTGGMRGSSTAIEMVV